jgi:anti-sigma-K factor RskA
MNYLLPERLDRLAREYALGTLAGGARRRFERVLAQSPAAGRAVAAWQERFTVLSAGLPPMAPRRAVWQGLEQRLFAAPRKAFTWWRALGGALAGVLLCTVVLRLQPGLIGLEPQADALPASYVGLLTDAQGKPAVLASSRRQGRHLTVKLLQPLSVPADRVAQLWALPSDGSAAFPVGVVPAGGNTTLTLSDSSEKLFFKVSRLAVSLEASAAKPGDKPTQPFILSGHCVKLW